MGGGWGGKSVVVLALAVRVRGQPAWASELPCKGLLGSRPFPSQISSIRLCKAFWAKSTKRALAAHVINK